MCHLIWDKLKRKVCLGLGRYGITVPKMLYCIPYLKCRYKEFHIVTIPKEFHVVIRLNGPLDMRSTNLVDRWRCSWRLMRNRRLADNVLERQGTFNKPRETFWRDCSNHRNVGFIDDELSRLLGKELYRLETFFSAF